MKCSNFFWQKLSVVTAIPFARFATKKPPAIFIEMGRRLDESPALQLHCPQTQAICGDDKI